MILVQPVFIKHFCVLGAWNTEMTKNRAWSPPHPLPLLNCSLRYLNGVELLLAEGCIVRIISQDKNWNESYAGFHLKIL